jgi:DDE superfamily endonuclease
MTSSRTRSARKKRLIRRQIRALPRRSVVLAQDETDLLLFPPLRASWSKRGEVVKVSLSGRNARRVIFGAMNLRTGTRLFVPREKGRSGDFQAFLGEVRSRYRGWHVALLLDEDPSHTAKASLRETEGMTLLWLPNRSPKLNPMDTLWGQGKDVISANKQYATIDEQVDRFLDYLCSLTNQEALHTAGVLSKRFWLKRALSDEFWRVAELYCNRFIAAAVRVPEVRLLGSRRRCGRTDRSTPPGGLRQGVRTTDG